MSRIIRAAVFVALACVTASTVGAQEGAPASQGRMLRPKLITHVVGNLQKSIAFYREALNLEVVSGPGPLAGSMLMHKAHTTSASAKATAAILRLPGSNLQLQLVEFSGLPAKPMTQQLYDPGITRLSIQVRDIDKAFAQAKDHGVTVDTTSAGPVFTQRPRNNTRAVMMHDPDGFVFEFVEAGTMPPTDVPATSNIYNARSSLAIDSFEKSLPFYRDILGFTLNSQPNDINDAVLALEGTPRANARTAPAMPPGSNNMWVLWEFRDVQRTKHMPAVQDPGASAITLEVENLAALVARMKTAGIQVELEPMPLEGGHRGALVRSPDGLLVELME